MHILRLAICAYHSMVLTNVCNTVSYRIVSPSWKKKIPLFHLFNPSPTLPEPLATTDVFIFTIILPFPECSIIEIMQYVTYDGMQYMRSNLTVLQMHEVITEGCGDKGSDLINSGNE